MLLSEAKLLEGFSSLAIDSSHYHTLLTLPVHTADTKSFAVDVRNESVVVSHSEIDNHRPLVVNCMSV